MICLRDVGGNRVWMDPKRILSMREQEHEGEEVLAVQMGEHQWAFIPDKGRITGDAIHAAMIAATGGKEGEDKSDEKS